MTALVDELVERHTRYWLDLIAAEDLSNLISSEAEAALAWVETVELQTLMPLAEAAWRVRALIARVTVTDDFRALMVTLAEAALDSQHLTSIRLRSVAPRDNVEALNARLHAFDAIRAELIDQILSSELFAEFLSDILYHSIKDYALTENFLARRLPGVPSLMKLGKGVMNRTAPKLEEAVEKTIKEYLATNLKRPIALTKRFVERRLTTENLGEGLLYLRDRHRNQPLSGFRHYMDSKDLVEVGAIVGDALLQLRSAPRIDQLTDELIGEFYAAFGEQPVGALFDLLGLERREIVSGLEHLLVPLISQARASGYLEERIRERMKMFYASEDIAALLEGVPEKLD